MARRGPAYYRSVAAKFARQEGIPVEIFLKQIGAEAGFRTNATSPAGARGIAQIMPFHDVQPNVPGHQVAGRDPIVDLRWSARHNAQNLRKYGNVKDMLSVYNSGRPWAQGKGISETRNYVSKILGGSSGAVMKDRAAESETGFQRETSLTGPDTPRNGLKNYLMTSLMNYAQTGQTLGPLDLYAMTRAQAADVPPDDEPTPTTPYAPVGRVGSLPGGKGITYSGQKFTHPTSGLGGYPAVDLFAKPGTPFTAPEAGTVYRHSGRGGTSGGIYGRSIYFKGQSGKDYFITHLGQIAPKGRYRRGQTLGTVSPWKSGAPHAHVGVRG
jgi:Transglycosylase SLT domain